MMMIDDDDDLIEVSLNPSFQEALFRRRFRLGFDSAHLLLHNCSATQDLSRTFAGSP